MTAPRLAPLAMMGALGLSGTALAGDDPGAAEAGLGLCWRRLVASPAVYLRPLSFDMGSTEEEVLSALVRCKREPLPERCDETTFTSETPAHHEYVAGFWMSRTEVTVTAYERCVAVGHCRSAGFEAGALRFRRADFPVTFVTFDDAQRYCAFRGGRLPTEAQFERAARGPARRQYPWGQRYHGRVSNHGRLGVDTTDSSDGFAELAPVGSFPDGATPEGILDLAGNAAEWTADAFTRQYQSAPTTERTVRGGSWSSAAPFVRGAARVGKPPEAREPTLGFRCVWQTRPVNE